MKLLTMSKCCEVGGEIQGPRLRGGLPSVTEYSSRKPNSVLSMSICSKTPCRKRNGEIRIRAETMALVAQILSLPWVRMPEVGQHPHQLLPTPHGK